MKKIFPLLLAIAIGLSGYLYFNQNILTSRGIEKVFIYSHDEYKEKKPLPFIKVEKQNLINIVIDTINSSQDIDRELSVTEYHYVLDIIYEENNKETFYLWINEDTNNAMYQNKNDLSFHVITQDDTNKLKTLIFR